MDTLSIYDRKNIQLSHVHSVYFKFTGNECVAGKSYVTNKVGMFFMYMGDDMRKIPSTQIIVVNLGGGDLHFLPTEAKKEIEIISSGY